jgi:hypothetical protein
MPLALSIRQPWAWAVVAGIKTVENRSWKRSYRGLLVIHAGVVEDPSGLAFMRRLGVEPPEHVALGAFVGVVELRGVTESSVSSWAIPGCYHWILADAVMFEHPIPCRGMPGLFAPRSTALRQTLRAVL